MSGDEQIIYNQNRSDCWNSALHSFGYGYLYSIEANKIRKVLKFNTFLGIIIPIVIGGVVTSFGLDFKYISYLLIAASILSIIQLVLSTFILSYNLEDKFSYYLESSSDNYRLADDYEKLGKYPPNNLSDLQNEIDKVNIRRNNRDNSDNKYTLPDKSKRRGMRYSLRKFRRECAGCRIIPTDMSPTNCGVCGKF